MTSLLAAVASGPVELAPIRARDARDWGRLRRENGQWLGPWEATSPSGHGEAPPNFRLMARSMRAEARAGRTIPWMIRYQGDLVGQLTVFGISYGALRSASAGYWVARSHAGRGIVPCALAMATDFCWNTIGLHRMEVNIRPENEASRRVVEKLGFRCEGTRQRYLHIDGQWRDHLSYALTAEEVPAGLLERWHARSALPSPPPGEAHRGPAIAPGHEPR